MEIPLLIVILVGVAAVAAANYGVFSRLSAGLGSLLSQLESVFSQLELVYRTLTKVQSKEQPFAPIGDDQLAYEEEQASEVWVLTARLDKDTDEQGPIQKAVIKNLRAGVRYSYFLPHPQERRHKLAQENAARFKELAAVKRHMGQIRFHHLPPRFPFLTQEMVVHNPSRRTIRGVSVEPSMFYYIDPEGTQLVRAPAGYAQWVVDELESYFNSETLPQLCHRLVALHVDKLDPVSLAALHGFGTSERSAEDLASLVGGMMERRRDTRVPDLNTIEAIHAELRAYFDRRATDISE